ncbi:MAG: galactosyldiacylglycerol synthase [Alicyclobacillus sp.]|nr:galactosyldiacylglycerol synthase [Alicyclobacillus sp.]
MTRLLILYAAIGDGHRQAAHALLEACSRRPEIEAVAVDNFRATHPLCAWLSEGCYRLSTRFFPWLYGWSYRVTRRLPSHHWLWQLLALLSRQGACRALREHQPDVVLQLFPDLALAFPARSGDQGQAIRRPLQVVVVTDFSLHGRWFSHQADVFCLPAPALARAAQAQGYVAPGQACWGTGIPVRRQFAACVRPLPLPPRQYVVVLTGGRGVFPQLAKVLLALRSARPELAVHVLCGRNARMYKLVSHLAARDPGIEAHGFVEQVASFLQGAAFAVLKAGGLTVAEALAAACPMLLYKPQPGQEADNAAFVEAAGAGRCVRNLRELQAVLPAFTGSTLEQMRAAAAAVGQPGAADAVLDRVLVQLALHRTAGQAVAADQLAHPGVEGSPALG